MKPDVRVFANVGELYLQAAAAVARTIEDAVRAAGRCSIALSGGSTPVPLYTLLATRFRDLVPWARLHVFWADERYVPPGDPRSNQGMARSMLLDRVACPAANIHPMPTLGPDPDRAARDYETVLDDYFGHHRVRFDLALLGLGSDGHTASLFPGSPALDERARLVLAVTAPAEPSVRLTLTPLAFAGSEATFFLVTGSAKARALDAVLTESADPALLPAAAVRAAAAAVVWWVDRDAAAGLPSDLREMRP